jgi:hypothetical protein
VTRTVATAAAAIIRRVAERFVRFLCDEILYFPCKVQLLCPGAVGRMVNLVVPWRANSTGRCGGRLGHVLRDGASANGSDGSSDERSTEHGAPSNGSGSGRARLRASRNRVTADLSLHACEVSCRVRAGDRPAGLRLHP